MFRTKAIVVLIIILFTMMYFTTDDHRKSPDNTKPKYILYWTKMFDRNDFYLGLGDIFKDCPVSNCVATNNRNLLDIEEFDAILFHGPEYNFAADGKPSRRSPHQIYIYSNQESPIYTMHKENFRNFFNWTMTYRLDSDVVRSYGSLLKEKTKYELPTPDSIKRRRNKVAWFVSHCDTESYREMLQKTISTYLPVDVYGTCGSLKCERNNETQCFKLLEENYKFYLSFENSLCEDYVTEKLYNVLKLNVIPIVYGGAQYEKFAPSHSIIDVAKFPNVSSLVDYIKRLDENVTEYLEYFKWKKYYTIDVTPRRMLCSLCEKLNKPVVKKQYDVDKWWGKDQCKKPPLNMLI